MSHRKNTCVNNKWRCFVCILYNFVKNKTFYMCFFFYFTSALVAMKYVIFVINYNDIIKKNCNLFFYDFYRFQGWNF